MSTRCRDSTLTIRFRKVIRSETVNDLCTSFTTAQQPEWLSYRSFESRALSLC